MIQNTPNLLKTANLSKTDEIIFKHMLNEYGKHIHEYFEMSDSLALLNFNIELADIELGDVSKEGVFLNVVYSNPFYKDSVIYSKIYLGMFLDLFKSNVEIGDWESVIHQITIPSKYTDTKNSQNVIPGIYTHVWDRFVFKMSSETRRWWLEDSDNILHKKMLLIKTNNDEIKTTRNFPKCL